jgi:hypothetical protein
VLYAQGTGYVANASQILFGTLALPASVTVSGEWYATIPASALAKKGTIQVALKNPTPGGGTTSTLPFTVK